MKTALFYDTETTGLPLFDAPDDHPGQPHIVQLAACLVDIDKRETISSFDVTIRPDGWTIPDEVAKIHGITTERASDVGIDAPLALDMLMHLWRRAGARIGHNEQFDCRIVRIGLLRHFCEAEANTWAAGAAQCTQVLSTPVLKLPPTPRMIAAGRRHHKSANLGEAYRHFTGKPLEGAHSAMVDVRACMAVFFAIHDLKQAA